MSPPSSLRASPFAEDQMALIERLLREASPEQMQWLSGYVAGFQTATRGVVATTAPAEAASAARAALTILYASESGNAEALARTARKEAQRAGFAPKLLDMADTVPERLPEGDLVLIASTWGEGDPPQRAEAFMAALLAPTAPRLEGRRFAVLALGDRAYVNFCATGRVLDSRLAELGAERILPLTECDLDYEAAARAWTASALTALGAVLSPAEDAAEGAVIRVDFGRGAAEPEVAPATFEATLSERQLLSSSRSSSEVWHLELATESQDLAWEPGDSVAFAPRNDPALVAAVLEAAGLAGANGLGEELANRYDITTLTAPQLGDYAALTGTAEQQPSFREDRQLIDLLETAPAKLTPEQLVSLLRPLPPRLYSIASAPESGSIDLLVAAVRWQSHGRDRNGVASVDLVSRRSADTPLPLALRPNPHFRLPADPDQPIIMVGPGTGIAPFRAFLERREAAASRGKSWLFFGARNFTHDFLYQLEIQDWLQSGVLTRANFAFSRDQPEKIYVQHRMWEEREELWRWLADGAVLYVCGDAKAMARDVHATLIKIIAEATHGDTEGAAQWLRAAVADGRYKRDVY